MNARQIYQIFTVFAQTPACILKVRLLISSTETGFKIFLLYSFFLLLLATQSLLVLIDIIFVAIVLLWHFLLE